MVAEVGTPEWWLHRLLERLQVEAPVMQRWSNYYHGIHDLPPMHTDMTDDDRFRWMATAAQSNFLRIVVDAPVQRLRVQGFRTSGEATETDDRESWQLWQANGLDTWSKVLFREALVKSRSYLLVWPTGAGGARITVEDALQTVVEHDPADIRNRRAGLKYWLDDVAGAWRADVHLPDRVHRFAAEAHNENPTGGRLTPTPVTHATWEPLDSIPNPLRVVSIVPLYNRPTIYGEGESEIGDLLPIQDRINKTLFDRMVAAEFAAFRQRWATGLEIPTDPVTGQDVEPFKAAVNRVWVNEDPQGKFGEFGQTDLKPYIEAIEQDVNHIATESQTPRHYLMQQGQSPSGDAIKSWEAGLTSKVRDEHDHFGEPLEEAMRLARRAAGHPEDSPDSEVVWANPEFRTRGELTDAVTKEVQMLGIPVEAAWEEIGRSPTQIRRYKAMQAGDQLMRRMLQPADPETPEPDEAA